MGTLFALNSTWHFKLLSIYFIVYFFIFSVLYCQRFWIIKINQLPGIQPDTTNKEPGTFDILPVLDGCITHIYGFGKIWGCSEKGGKKKERKNNNTHGHCCKKLNRHSWWTNGYRFCFEAFVWLIVWKATEKKESLRHTLLSWWVNHQELHQIQRCYTSVTEGGLRGWLKIYTLHIRN